LESEGHNSDRVPLRDDVLAYIDGLLEVTAFEDFGPQGLQVEGCPTVRRLVTGVSASVALFKAAAATGADLVLVHHGLLWDSGPRILRGGMRERVRLLLDHDMNLAGYHLCLDAHPDLGNNAVAARGLGLADVEPWGRYRGRDIGVRGHWDGVDAAAAVARLEELYGGPVLSFLSGPREVRSVGIVSGGAAGILRQAAIDGLDMFVTGEAAEFTMHAAAEAAIHFVAAGHYNTERLGIRALGEHVAERFALDHEFIDLPNPV